MAVQIYHYDSLEKRDKGTVRGGTLVGEATTAREFTKLVDAAPKGALGYFVDERCVQSWEEAIETLGGDPFLDDLMTELLI